MFIFSKSFFKKCNFETYSRSTPRPSLTTDRVVVVTVLFLTFFFFFINNSPTTTPRPGSVANANPIPRTREIDAVNISTVRVVRFRVRTDGFYLFARFVHWAVTFFFRDKDNRSTPVSETTPPPSEFSIRFSGRFVHETQLINSVNTIKQCVLNNNNNDKFTTIR